MALRSLAQVGSGMDRWTGKTLSGWDQTAQSIETIFTTGIGERVMREWFGSGVPYLLGRNIMPAEVSQFWQAFWWGIDMYEPRFRCSRLEVTDVNRQGQLFMIVEGQYRPYAHLRGGSLEVEGGRKVRFNSNPGPSGRFVEDAS